MSMSTRIGSTRYLQWTATRIICSTAPITSRRTAACPADSLQRGAGRAARGDRPGRLIGESHDGRGDGLAGGRDAPDDLAAFRAVLIIVHDESGVGGEGEGALPFQAGLVGTVPGPRRTRLAAESERLHARRSVLRSEEHTS